MKAREGLLAGTVGRVASSYSHVWRVREFRRFTEWIKIAFMAVSCTLLLVLVVANWCSPVLRGVICTFKYEIVTVWLFRKQHHFWNAYSWTNVVHVLPVWFFPPPLICIERHVGMLHTIMFVCLFLYPKWQLRQNLWCILHIELKIREINESTAGWGVQTDTHHDGHVLYREQMCITDKRLCASVCCWWS